MTASIHSIPAARLIAGTGTRTTGLTQGAVVFGSLSSSYLSGGSLLGLQVEAATGDGVVTTEHAARTLPQPVLLRDNDAALTRNTAAFIDQITRPERWVKGAAPIFSSRPFF